MAPRWFLTRHCLARAAEMGLTRADVVLVVEEPEVEYPATGGRRLSQRGCLAVVWDPVGYLAVTVLRREADRWTHETP